MLHIILLILKIIGIILAVILGILVLLLLIVLFVPIRYKLTGDCKGTLDSLDGRLKVTWFLHLVTANVIYRNRTFEWEVRVAWKKWNAASGEASVDEARELVKEKVAPEVEEVAEETTQEIEGPADKPVKEIAEEIKQEAVHFKADSKEIAKEIGEEVREEKKVSEKVKAIWDRIKEFFQNIKYTISKIYDKIKVLMKKKDYIMDFLTDEVHQAAFRIAKRELIRLLRYLRPKKFQADLLVGFEDPYNTGCLLAGYSMVYPFIGKQAVLTPDFEKKVLEGTLLVKGCIKMVYFVILGWNLLWSREVRKTYKDIRGFKL